MMTLRLFSSGKPARIGWAMAFWSAMTAAATAQVVDHPTTFTGQTDLTFNGNASVTAGKAQLTPALGNQGGSFFSTAQVPVDKFVARFVFHELGTVGGMADGLGFCIQRVGPTALGGIGGGMGYSGMLTSIFIKFDCYSNVSTTRLLQNGAAPDDTNSIDMRPNVDVHSQHDFQVDLNYNGTVIAMTVKDLTTNAVFTTNFTVNIPAVIGGATAHVGFTGATGGAVANQEILNFTYAYLPTPTNLTATNGPNQVSLGWGASAGATSYTVLRSSTTGGPYTVLQAGVAGTTFVDTTAVNPNSYFYVVQAVEGAHLSVFSNQAVGNPLAPAVSALPNSGLQTNETGTTTTFQIKFNQMTPAGGSLVTVSSTDVGEGTVSTAFTGGTVTATATGFTVQLGANASPTIDVVITGVDDAVVDNNQTYPITVSATNMGVTIPNVVCTNNDDDIQGITFTRTAGITTSEDGTSAQVAVVLNRQPFGTVTLNVSSSTPAEGAVSPGTLTFTAANWNQGNLHLITVTGVDDPALDFTQAYSIITAPLQFSDPNDQAAFNTAGATDPPDLGCLNLDNEQIPSLEPVWGQGGCGLTGLEVVLLLGLGAARRRRRIG